MKWYHACDCGAKWFCPREFYNCPRCGVKSASPEMLNVPWEVTMKVSRISIEKIEPDPDNPRKAFDTEEIAALGVNMMRHAQQVPVIVYPMGDKYGLADGERRWRAAKAAGIAELLAIVHPSKPDDATLAMMQMSLEVHKVSLSAMERSDLLSKIKACAGLNVSDLAERLQMSQPLVTKLLALQKLIPEAKAAVQSGKLCIEKAYSLSGETDPQRQAELFNQSLNLSRDQLRTKLRNRTEVEPRTKRAVFAMAGGVSVTLQGGEVTLGDAIERLGELIKELRRGLNQGLDISTQQRVMRDKAK